MTQPVLRLGGFKFLAETHPKVTKTVEAFMKLLPYERKLIHMRWSGEGVWDLEVLKNPRPQGGGFLLGACLAASC